MSGNEPVDATAPQPLEAQPGRSRAPLVATIAGSAFILLMIGRPAAPLADNPVGRLVYASGLAIAPAILVGVVVYLVALRHASARWKIGSLVTIVLVSLCVGLVRTGGSLASSERDLAAAEDQLRRFEKDPTAMPVPTEDAGPYSRMVASLVAATAGDRRAFDQEMAHAGFNQVLTLEGLKPSSPSLSRCDRFDRLREQAGIIGSRWPAHVARARAIGEAGGMPEDQLRAFDQGYGKADYAGTWKLNGEIAAGVGEMCRFLASHKWENGGGKALFLSSADLAQFNGISAGVQGRLDEQQRRVAQLADPEQASGR